MENGEERNIERRDRGREVDRELEEREKGANKMIVFFYTSCEK